jgi:hypothetical protein
MHLIDLIEKELQAYRKPGGQSISRTARALDEARSMVGAQTKGRSKVHSNELSLATSERPS